MKLINARQPTSATALTPRQQATLARYGDKAALIAKFTPAQLPDIYKQLDRSVEADVPSVVTTMRAYGDDVMQFLLGAHVQKVMMYNGIPMDKIDSDTTQEIARNMLLDERYRILNMAFALAFFQEVMMGKYKLYGCRPIDFMNALQDYVKTAHQRQVQLTEELEKQQREAKAEENKRLSVTFEQYCASRGLDPKTTPNPLHFAQQRK